jgi:ribosomal-protein-alanine N-acetyltransferase
VSIIETARLRLRRLSPDDAAFILGLLNEPSFLKFVGDKNVRTLDDARAYIETGPAASYERFGFGLYLVTLKHPVGSTDPRREIPIGICGLVKRDGLQHPDVGFAFRPEYWSKGYAAESAAAVLTYATTVLGLTRVDAITNPDNVSSIRVLEKIGLRFDRMVRLTEEGADLKLWTTHD